MCKKAHFSNVYLCLIISKINNIFDTAFQMCILCLYDNIYI